MSRLKEKPEKQTNNPDLLKCEEYLISITENFPEHVMILDTDYTIRFINHTVPDLTKSDVIGRSNLDFVPPDYKKVVLDCFDRVIKSGKPDRYETTYISVEGETLFFDVRISPLMDKEGNISGLLSISNEITESRRMKEALRESEERYRSLSEAAFEAIFISEKGICVEQNPAAEKMFGYTASEAIGREGTDWIVPEDRELVMNNMLSDYEEPYEVTALRKDGSTFPSEIQGKIMHYRGRDVRVTALSDITKRKNAVNALKESEENLLEAQNIAKLGRWELDLVANQLEWSSTIYMIFEIDPEMFDACYEAFVDAIHPDDRALVNQAYSDSLKSRKPYNIEHRLLMKDGRVKWVNEICNTTYDADGQPVRSIGVVQDITERKEIEEQLRQVHKMESVGRLAGGVAHDFNNMLGVILGHTEMALEQIDPTQPLYAHLMEIRSAADRSADLTGQLLAFARKQTITPRELNLNDTVEGMLKMLQRLIGEDIDLCWLPGTDLWPIKMDPSQIDQIMANLCVNARDAIKGVGRVTIKTEDVTLAESYCADYPELTPGEYVLLTVSDNGCGMNKKVLDMIFEPFFTSKAIGKGTGLGLATVYGIVKQNSGYIYASSEPGKGTAFNIYLPRHSAGIARIVMESQEEAARLVHETILLVEDEPAILKLTKMMLERLGYSVLTASTPGEAIRLAGEHSNRIHLIMTDVVMPEMNGRDLAKNLLSIYPDIKRLFMSGYTANVIAHHGVLDEGVHFIQKPFTIQGLAAKMREVLDRE